MKTEAKRKEEQHNCSPFQDYYTVGFRRPPMDTSQDYKLTSSSQKNGKTFLEFERKLSTSDQKDIEIKVRTKVRRNLPWF